MPNPRLVQRGRDLLVASPQRLGVGGELVGVDGGLGEHLEVLQLLNREAGLEIVDDLGVSRTSLYAALEPIPAGLVCTDCDERMVFTNRTARDRGLATCPSCGRESEPGADFTRIYPFVESEGG